MRSVFHDCRVTVLGAQVADDTIVTFPHVDMAADGGYESVAFIFGVVEGAVYADYVPKAQADTTTAFSAAADLAGTAHTFSSLTGVVTAELDIGKHVGDRYVRPILTVPNVSATCVVTCTAIQYNPRQRPATQDSTTSGGWTGEFVASPAEGTA